ncbi:unnamed protein product [Schistosoma margrebowiei]|uniref:Uncharacterized protein n=1 Tax=Schistosoma margrebowiei TaxID=48269 RepID=A0A183MSW4_9TREM|nr:unnamed protein product [Schistosoma margrebowiei]
MTKSTSEEKQGIQWTAENKLHDLDLADNPALLSRTHEQIQMKTTSVAEESASINFKIHNEKGNILKSNTERTKLVTLDGETLTEAETFTYLIRIIFGKGRSDAEVNSRIGKTRTAFLQLKSISYSKQLSGSRYRSQNLQ